jgi:hypothetical protein
MAQLVVAGALASGVGGAPILISLVSFAAALMLASLFIPPEPAFEPLPSEDHPGRRYGVLLAFLACFLYPFLASPVRGIWNLVHTPMGLVPQPTLGVFLLLAIQSSTGRVRQAGCVIAGLALVMAVVDLLGGYRVSAAIMAFAGGGFLITEFITRTKFIDRSEPVDEPPVVPKPTKSLPPATPSAPRQAPATRKESKPSGKSWDI